MVNIEGKKHKQKRYILYFKRVVFWSFYTLKMVSVLFFFFSFKYCYFFFFTPETPRWVVNKIYIYLIFWHIKRSTFFLDIKFNAKIYLCLYYTLKLLIISR